MGRGKGCYIGLFTNNLGGSGMILDDRQLKAVRSDYESKDIEDYDLLYDCRSGRWINSYDLLETLEHNQSEYDKKEIAYMKQIHELEKEVERLENIEQELTDLKNHYKSKIL